MAGLIQYQAFTEPVPRDAETVQVDKFDVCAVMPTYQRYPVRAGWYDRPYEITLTVPVNIDWERDTERPRNPVPPRLQGQQVLAVEPTLITTSTIEWYRPAERPANPRPVYRPDTTHVAPPDEPERVAREWGAFYPNADPVRRKPGAVQAQPPAVYEPTDTPGIFMGWWQPASGPRWTVRPRQYQSVADEREPTLFTAQNLDWLRDAEQPLKRVRPRPVTGAVMPHFPDDAERAMTWIVAVPEPLRPRRLVQTGLWVAQVVIDLLGLDWLRETNARHNVRPRLNTGEAFTTDERMVVPADGWCEGSNTQVRGRLVGMPHASNPSQAVEPFFVAITMQVDDRDAAGDDEGDADLPGG